MDKIKAGFMTQLYRDISAELKLTVNNSVLEEMETKNKEELEKLTGQCPLFCFFWDVSPNFTIFRVGSIQRYKLWVGQLLEN